MNQRLLDILLYISSFIPLYLLVVLKTIIEIINGNLTFNINNTILISAMMMLTLFGVIGIVYLFKREDRQLKKVKIISTTNLTDIHFLGYFSLFVLFALTFDLSKVSMSIVYLIILLLIGIVYVRNNLFYINPLLNIIGYSFYEVEYIDSNGSVIKTKVYSKGKLSVGSYELSCNKNGMCFVLRNKNIK
ncbi:MAG: hypothetical protein IJA61_03770 [Clostridia bacterium]|nr:hypothetical protein [Clostridia bacterium]